MLLVHRLKSVNHPVPPWHSSGTRWYCLCCRKIPTLICLVKGTWKGNLLTEETQSTSYSKNAFLTLFFCSNNTAVIKCVMEGATNEIHWYRTVECEAAICPAPTKAKIKATNKQFPYVQFSLLTTVGSLKTNFK